MLSLITYLAIPFHLFFLLPTGYINSHTTLTSPAEDCGHSWSRLDISALYKAVQLYYKHSLAPCTRELYTYGIQCYLQFCNLISHPTLPAQNEKYHFSRHTLHWNTYLQAPYRFTPQLSATCTSISRHTPPNLLLQFSRAYVALNNIRPVHPLPYRDHQSLLTSCTELKLFCSSQTHITKL